MYQPYGYWPQFPAHQAGYQNPGFVQQQPIFQGQQSPPILQQAPAPVFQNSPPIQQIPALAPPRAVTPPAGMPSPASAQSTPRRRIVTSTVEKESPLALPLVPETLENLDNVGDDEQLVIQMPVTKKDLARPDIRKLFAIDSTEKDKEKENAEKNRAPPETKVKKEVTPIESPPTETNPQSESANVVNPSTQPEPNGDANKEKESSSVANSAQPAQAAPPVPVAPYPMHPYMVPPPGFMIPNWQPAPPPPTPPQQTQQQQQGQAGSLAGFGTPISPSESV